MSVYRTAILSYSRWLSGSPAEQAGLREGDVIEAVNGVNVLTLRQLSTQISRSMDGAAFRIRRGAIPIAQLI